MIKLDKHSFTDNMLRREMLLDINNKLIKIKVDRNCNDYNANIRVSLIDLDNVKEIELLFYNSEELQYSDLSCYHKVHMEGVINKNTLDINKIIKDIKDVLL